ncbi:MAG: CRISPR-associated protein Cas4 [Candidatus Alcyoniella australis]|nr:CRISPR-associated protein Cas4 [Candidatus Alcyoniella australis]
MDVDDLLPLSGLQHVVFCERQCALIHVEGVWVENPLTAAGRVEHEHVHDPAGEVRAGLRICRALALRSERLGVVGVADVVELVFEEAAGVWRPFPVEHKHGAKGRRLADRVQLCAQAMALEEMLGVDVPRGAVFYRSSNRRVVVECDALLREKTFAAAKRYWQLVDQRLTPRASYAKKCDNCSLREVCLPEITADVNGFHRKLARAQPSDPDGGKA